MKIRCIQSFSSRKIQFHAGEEYEVSCYKHFVGDEDVIKIGSVEFFWNSINKEFFEGEILAFIKLRGYFNET